MSLDNFEFRLNSTKHRKPHVAWEVSMYLPAVDGLEVPYAVATAYVSDYGWYSSLDFVIVPDHLRRRGYATQVIKACFRRWPDLQLTDGINEAGKALAAKFEQKEGE